MAKHMAKHMAKRMSEHTTDLHAECRAFTRFLTAGTTTPYVLASYERLLPSASIGAAAESRLIERALVSFARRGAVPARIADSYARFFLPRSLLRRRLVLLLAILENSPTTERPMNSAIVASPVAVFGRLAVIGVAFAASLLVGVVLFAPLHLASGASTNAPVAGH